MQGLYEQKPKTHFFGRVPCEEYIERLEKVFRTLDESLGPATFV